MKIAMIGSGAAGSVFASYLTLGGADNIWLVDPYKAHMDKIAADGLKFKDPSGEYVTTGYKTTTDSTTVGIADIVIIMVKTTHTHAAMKTAEPCIGPNTVVATLQNGLGNEEVVKQYVPADRVIFGCGNMGTEMPEPGSCVSKPQAGVNMYFGPAEKSELNDAAGKYLEKCFKSAACVPEYYDDVRPKMWRKATSNSGFNTTCAILRLQIGEVHDDPNGLALVWGIWNEAAAVAEAMGIPGIADHMKGELPAIRKNIGNYYPSMAQDTMAHRQTEADSLTGAIAMYGAKYGVATPYCEVLTKVVKAIEANYDKQYKDK